MLAREGMRTESHRDRGGDRRGRIRAAVAPPRGAARRAAPRAAAADRRDRLRHSGPSALRPSTPACCCACPTSSRSTYPRSSRRRDTRARAVIPAVSSVLSLLALKLASIRRTSHVEDLATDHGAALFAGLSSLPKTTALTSYSYKLSHERQHAFLVALNHGDAACGADRRHRLRPRFPRDHALGRGRRRWRNTTFPAARNAPARC